uniref:Uncharacterized protein n=1 Tax=Panagrolaimus sp. ES5 TaxID=591445 RepID=A0AC34GKC1_9BILA
MIAELFGFLFIVFHLTLVISTIGFGVTECCKKKKTDTATGAVPAAAPTPGSEGTPATPDAAPSNAAAPAAADGPKVPAAGGIAGTHDPNYQTLAGMGQECFGADKAGGGGAAAPAPAADGPKVPTA